MTLLITPCFLLDLWENQAKLRIISLNYQLLASACMHELKTKMDTWEMVWFWLSQEEVIASNQPADYSTVCPYTFSWKQQNQPY